jgi:hypothetical protein
MCIQDLIKPLQEEMGSDDIEETSARPEELPAYVPEHMKFIWETTEEAGL